MLFNESYNINLKFNNMKSNCEKDEDKLKTHVFDVLPEKYNPVKVSCNINIENMVFKLLKKEIQWFWKIELNIRKAQKGSNIDHRKKMF